MHQPLNTSPASANILFVLLAIITTAPFCGASEIQTGYIRPLVFPEKGDTGGFRVFFVNTARDGVRLPDEEWDLLVSSFAKTGKMLEKPVVSSREDLKDKILHTFPFPGQRRFESPDGTVSSYGPCSRFGSRFYAVSGDRREDEKDGTGCKIYYLDKRDTGHKDLWSSTDGADDFYSAETISYVNGWLDDELHLKRAKDAPVGEDDSWYVARMRAFGNDRLVFLLISYQDHVPLLIYSLCIDGEFQQEEIGWPFTDRGHIPISNIEVANDMILFSYMSPNIEKGGMIPRRRLDNYPDGLRCSVHLVAISCRDGSVLWNTVLRDNIHWMTELLGITENDGTVCIWYQQGAVQGFDGPVKKENITRIELVFFDVEKKEVVSVKQLSPYGCVEAKDK
jgi:hypothetical protein